MFLSHTFKVSACSVNNLGGTSKTAKVVEPTACFSMPSLSTVGERAGEMVLVMVPLRVHAPSTHHALRAGTAKPGLSCHGVFHKVHDPFHHPPAPVSGPGVYWQPVLQAHQGHCDQDPTLDLVPAPKRVQPVAVFMCQFILVLHPLTLYWCKVTMMILPWLEKRMHLTRAMKKLCHKVLSLPDISASDNEDACKALVREAVCKSDVQYGNWRDEQICQGNEGIAQWDKGINDYADIGKPCKAPDKIGPPLAYMEKSGVFKPLDSMANLLGLCQFYHTNPDVLKSIPAPKSSASVCRVKCLLEKDKDLGQPYIIVVFEGGNVTLLGLLQELHSRFTLSYIPIFTSDEAKLGQKT